MVKFPGIRILPHHDFPYYNAVMKLICGIDEAGRGPLAGPVCAAAVILSPDFPVDMLNDSKRLSEEKRDAAAEIIRRQARAWAVGWVWPEEIDRLNIHHASLLAMQRAFSDMGVQPDKALVDGKFCPPLPCRSEAVIGGDGIVHEIMAASIIAKTVRDKWMCDYAKQEPQYLFEKHKGYPTPEHRRLLLVYGPSKIHRKSFRITSPETGQKLLDL